MHGVTHVIFARCGLLEVVVAGWGSCWLVVGRVAVYHYVCVFGIFVLIVLMRTNNENFFNEFPVALSVGEDD